ncbi:MAG TPA: hypothetical protein PKD85_00770 [Saprospiraceae bacterium]|nr:hypothetical protein [Saprospiraceae bacterium]
MIIYVLLAIILVFLAVHYMANKDNHQQIVHHVQAPTPSKAPESSLGYQPTGLGLYMTPEDKETNDRAQAVQFDHTGRVASRSPTEYAINKQYEQSFPFQNVRDMHPVLAYQYMHDKAINPANLGDPIRIPDVAGGKDGLYGTPRNFLDSLTIDNGSVPVPMGALKMTSEKYNKDMFRFNPLATGTIATPLAGSGTIRDNFTIAPLSGPGSNQNRVTLPGSLLPTQTNPYSSNFFRPYGPNVPVEPVPFFGSVNAYAPFPSIENPWEKAGILTSVGGDQILNLYRRPIAPLQDLWEYQVQDKDGFVIKLNVKYLEDGDLVPFVVGKNGMGPWKTHIFVQNKYVWV